MEKKTSFIFFAKQSFTLKNHLKKKKQKPGPTQFRLVKMKSKLIFNYLCEARDTALPPKMEGDIKLNKPNN